MGDARLILATHNEHKIHELRAILAPLCPDWDDAWVRGADGIAAPREDGTSFTENALIKARAISAATGLPALADDSGLTVDILGGAPGIFSARWAGRHGDDEANLRLLLDQLADVADPHRTASFVCAAAFVTPGNITRTALGEMRGRLLSAPVGQGGFGYDPIFVPEGHERTTAEMSAAEKNAISHRGAALRALAPVIAAVFTCGPMVADEI